MEFSAMKSFLGERSDDPAVLAMVVANGGPEQLKPTTDARPVGRWKGSTFGLEWSHENRVGAFPAPTKLKGKFVCRITRCTFDPAEVAGVPVDWVVGESVPAAADNEVQTDAFNVTTVERQLQSYPYVIAVGAEVADGRVGRKWYVCIQNESRYAYIRSDVSSHAFPVWHPSWPDAQRDLPTGMFVAWALLRGFGGERVLVDHPAEVEAVRQRRMTGREFLYGTAPSNGIWSSDFVTSLHQFVHLYSFALCRRNQSRIGNESRVSVDDDFVGLYQPLFANGALDAADSQNNFDRFALYLDARLADFGLTQFEQEIDEATSASVNTIYADMRKAMEALPPPDALADADRLPVPSGVPEGATAGVVELLGRRTDDPAVADWLTAWNVNLPGPGARSIDCSTRGLKLELGGLPDRLAQALDTKEVTKARRKKLQWITGAQFFTGGQIVLASNTNDYLRMERYPAELPLGLEIGASLEEFDAQLGGDNDQQSEPYGDENVTSRRWYLDHAGAVVAPEGEHFMVLVTFHDATLQDVRMLLQ